MTHTLDKALRNAFPYVFSVDTYRLDYSNNKDRAIGDLMGAAGMACIARSPERRGAHLEDTCFTSLYWWAELTGRSDDSARDDFAALVRAEYDRAHAKHQGMTPYNPSMSDDDRAAILGEEVGEVARALTPDADTAVGHGGELAEELVQTATMAAAWLARILDDTQGW